MAAKKNTKSVKGGKAKPKMSQQLHETAMGLMGEVVGNGLLTLLGSAVVEFRRFVRAQELQAAALMRVAGILERMEKRELEEDSAAPTSQPPEPSSNGASTESA